MNWTAEELGWPWVCLGGSLVMFALVFATNVTRTQPVTGSRWWDPVWLAWLLVPVLMFHMFEEYGHDALGHTYVLAETMCPTLGYPQYPACPIPRAHYPLINLGVAFLAVPFAAAFARRNLMVGLCLWGLVFLNGIFHVGGGIHAGEVGPGAVTGALFFIPLTLWVCYVIRKTRSLSRGELAVSLACGVTTHIALIAVLQLPRFTSIGATGILLSDCVVIVSGPALAAWTSGFFKSPVSASRRPSAAQA